MLDPAGLVILDRSADQCWHVPEKVAEGAVDGAGMTVDQRDQVRSDLESALRL